SGAALFGRRRQVIEDEIDAVGVALVHDAVDFLVVDLVGLADLELIRPTVDHEAHPRIRGDGHMDAMTGTHPRMRIAVRKYSPTGEQLGRHRADDRAARWIPLSDDRVHHWHRHGRKPIPTRLLADLDRRPILDLSEQEHDGAGLL